MKIQVTKQCTACGEDKPLTEFRKQSGKKLGLRYQCKTCQDDKEKDRYGKNKEVIKKRALERYYKIKAGL
jgi:ribosomal protein L44E